MNLRSATIISAVLLFVSAPAWGDSMKFKPGPNSAIHFFENSDKFAHSDFKFLGGFKPQNFDNHSSFFNFKEDRFVLVLPFWNWDCPSDPSDPKGGQSNDPVSTPEPATASLLLVGLLGAGAFAYRRSLS
jgi:hypothetical protein